MSNAPAHGSLMQSPLFPLALMMLIIYFLILRPQKKQQKQRADMLSGIKKNDQIITAGGIHGRVVLVKDKSLMVRVDDSVKIEIDKEAVSKVIKNEKT